MANHSPKNIAIAILSFLIGAFLTWWVGSRVSIFTGFFDNIFPQAVVWVAFLIMALVWVFIIPYRQLTGSAASPSAPARTFVRGGKGLVIATLIMIIGGSILTSLTTATGITGIAFVGWLLILAIIVKFTILDVLNATT